MSVRLNVSRELLNNLTNLHENLHRKLKGIVVKTALTKIETPAKRVVRVDTGRLRASIKTNYSTDTTIRFVCEVGTNVHYAKYIERRYPFLTTAYLTSLPGLRRDLSNAIRNYRG